MCVKGLTCSPFGADTNISVFPVLTSATILAGLTETLIDVSFTETAGVARTAVAGERGQAILTGTIVAGVRIALIDINFTVLPCVTCSGEEQTSFKSNGLCRKYRRKAAKRKPLLPSAHSQVYLFGPSVHLAPFLQGVLAHSSMSTWQRFPEKPGRDFKRRRN